MNDVVMVVSDSRKNSWNIIQPNPFDTLFEERTFAIVPAVVAKGEAAKKIRRFGAKILV